MDRSQAVDPHGCALIMAAGPPSRLKSRSGGEPLCPVTAELKARQDIHDVLVRYCRGADRCDAAMMKSCFHDDGWDDHGFFSGPASEFIEQAAKNLREYFISTKHFMTNEAVELDGDEARSETYILALLRKFSEGETFDVTLSARYLDRFERRDGQWKIMHRLLVNDGTRVDKVVREDARLNQGKPGCRGKEDPSYIFGPAHRWSE